MRDTEEDIYHLKNKSKSLQSQLSKKGGYLTERNIDEKIDQEISTYVKKDGQPGPGNLPGREAK